MQAAIAAANDPVYGKAVIGIVVGNEDMFDYKGECNTGPATADRSGY
jgi:hypothetical protein